MAYTEIWGDTIRQGVCKAPQCRRTIYFATNVRTTKDMPFSQRPVAVEIQPELETGRQQWTVDLKYSHFADCPGAPGFRRPR